MVFSQTSHRTRSILKVVEIDRLKEEKPAENGLNGVIDGLTATPAPACSFAEEYLKPEPVFESKMYHDTDYEFFHDLVGWCSDPAKEEQVQTIDSPGQTDDRVFNTDTLHTPLSPPGWDGCDVNFAAAQASFYTSTPEDPLSPAQSAPFDVLGLGPETAAEQFVDISSLPVVLDSAFDEPWKPLGWDTYTKPLTQDTPFIDQEDSQDMKYMSVSPREVESCDCEVVAEYVVAPRRPPLLLDVAARPARPAPPAHVISTPEVLSYVEQLEQEKHPLAAFKSRHALAQTQELVSPLAAAPAPLEYSPITPKSEAAADSEEEARAPRRRRRSEDSDESYSPHQERTLSRKYKRRKPNIPITDIIKALEGSQQLTKARRGRPPKRRASVVSSACSENSSLSTQDTKYRELRDKNNEASKRSRMHRKLKELQMEQEADELEERNQKLRVQAGVLEEMAKRLKEALLTSIMQK